MNKTFTTIWWFLFGVMICFTFYTVVVIPEMKRDYREMSEMAKGHKHELMQCEYLVDLLLSENKSN